MNVLFFLHLLKLVRLDEETRVLVFLNTQLG
jgi:hypothetical protein